MITVDILIQGFLLAKKRNGDNSDNSIRHIESDDPSVTAKDLYDRITHGGIVCIFQIYISIYLLCFSSNPDNN